MLLLACDFDGTLYRQGTIAESDRAAVSRFRERGNLFGIVTGRGATTLFRELGKHPVPFASVCSITEPWFWTERGVSSAGHRFLTGSEGRF